MAYRVNNVPLLLRPIFYLYAYAAAISGYAMLIFFRMTCRIDKHGDELPSNYNNAIYAIWHENLLLYFMIYLRYHKPYAWMNHPLWFMKPVHLILRFMGLKKLFLGSSGHGGKAALNKVTASLKTGYNTLIACDGPAGPYKVLKPGVLEMSKQTGIPVIAICFELSNYIRLPGWDKKKMPMPFSRVVVQYQAPIIVTDANYEKAKSEIAQLMG